MLNINRKNCYVTQKIVIKLKKMKRYLFDRTYLIKYN